MLNSTTCKTTYTTQDGVEQYPISFEYISPEHIAVSSGGIDLIYGVDYSVSEDGLSIQLLQAQEPGKKLVIERKTPFTQESDYQVGRINPEQIEKDFDSTNMKLQELKRDSEGLYARIDSVEAGIEEATTKANEVYQIATDASELATDAVSEAADATRIAQTATEIAASKQDVLVAGENITIEDNVISSTGGGGSAIEWKHTFEVDTAWTDDQSPRRLYFTIPEDRLVSGSTYEYFMFVLKNPWNEDPRSGGKQLIRSKAYYRVVFSYSQDGITGYATIHGNGLMTTENQENNNNTFNHIRVTRVDNKLGFFAETDGIASDMLRTFVGASSTRVTDIGLSSIRRINEKDEIQDEVEPDFVTVVVGRDDPYFNENVRMIDVRPITTIPTQNYSTAIPSQLVTVWYNVFGGFKFSELPNPLTNVSMLNEVLFEPSLVKFCIVDITTNSTVALDIEIIGDNVSVKKTLETGDKFSGVTWNLYAIGNDFSSYYPHTNFALVPSGIILQDGVEQKFSFGATSVGNSGRTVFYGIEYQDRAVGETDSDFISRQFGYQILGTWTATEVSDTSTIKADLDDLGDQVSAIESKIPGEASEQNQLATTEMVADVDRRVADVEAFVSNEVANLGDAVVETSERAEAALVTAQNADTKADLAQETADQADAKADETQNALASLSGYLASQESKLDETVETLNALAGAWDSKQDKLTAGEGITIEDNVISSTGGGDYLPLSGGTLTGNFASTSPALTILSNVNDVYGIEIRQQSGKGVIISANGTDGFSIAPLGTTRYLYFGNMMFNNTTHKLSNVKILNNGADIAVPTTGGTMVVATPPTDNGTYVLKATVVDGVITTEWVLEQ